jgi:hypothetical protein
MSSAPSASPAASSPQSASVGMASLLRLRLLKLQSNLSRWRSEFYGNSLSVTDDLVDTLQEWADSMKGKDDDPDVYFPLEHLRIINGLDKVAKVQLIKLAAMGRALRENKELGVGDAYSKHM